MKLEITVPESWEEIKLPQYVHYMKAIKPYEGVEDYEKIKIEKAMSHFCNISSETISKLPLENYNGISAYINNLFQQGEQLPLVKNFIIGDTKYGFMPSMDSMTYGEYLDLNTYSKDMWNNIATNFQSDFDGKYDIIIDLSSNVKAIGYQWYPFSSLNFNALYSSGSVSSALGACSSVIVELDVNPHPKQLHIVSFSFDAS